MMDLSNPHDLFFKESFSHPDVVRDFLQHYLPPSIAGLLDLPTLEVATDTFVDEKLHEHFSDLVCRVSLKQGVPIIVYTLFEHKSYPDRMVAFQLLRYIMRIWESSLETEGRLVPVFPIVFYHGGVKWRYPANLAALIESPPEFGAYQVDFQYHLCDLSQYSSDEIRGGGMLQVALLMMKYITSPELSDRLPGILQLVAQLSTEETTTGYLSTLIRYLLGGADQITVEEVHQVIDAVFKEKGTETMMTIADQLIEQGKMKGIQQGVQQGIQQGMRQGISEGRRLGLIEGIELVLEVKFGEQGTALSGEIRNILDLDVLEAIRLAIKNGASIAEIRRIYQKTTD